MSLSRSKIACILTLLLAFLSMEEVLSQNESKDELILLHGVVMDGESQLPLSNVHYMINNVSGGVSNPEGKFSMYISRSDSVRFSYLGYTDFILSLSDTLRGKSFVAAIFLRTETMAVGEVIVIPRLGDLRSEFRNSESEVSQEILNAQNNLEIATYQGLTSQAKLGDPNMNYEMIRRKQVIRANEMGGIPSEQMLGLNFISIIPAAIYLLSNGLPEKPKPPPPHVSPREINNMIELYKKNLKKE